MSLQELIDRLLRLVGDAGEGHLGIGLHEDGTWAVGCTWGREAPDSPMAGAAVYGIGETIEEALTGAVKDLR